MTIIAVGDKAKIADQIAEYQEATEKEPQMDTDAHR